MSRFSMDVKTLNNGVMDVKILNNGVNVARGWGKKKILLKSLRWQGLRMLEEQRWELCRKILLHPLRGIEHPCSILCVAQVLPPEYSVKAVEIKAWLLLRKRMTHNVTFFFFFLWEEGLNSMFSFLTPSYCNASLCGQAGWRADNESAEMWLLI